MKCPYCHKTFEKDEPLTRDERRKKEFEEGQKKRALASQIAWQIHEDERIRNEPGYC